MKNTNKLNAQELLKKYALEVGRYLPAQDRDDIVKEIYSTLTDTMEERIEGESASATAEDAYSLLKEMGHPRKTAASYLPPKYLIGPELFPAFMRIIRIALPAVAAALTGALILSAYITQGPEPVIGDLILEILKSVISALASAFGFIILVFIIIDKVNAGPKIAKELEDWTPKELVIEKQTGKVKLWEQIISLVFSILIIIALNFYIDRLGFNVVKGDTFFFVPKLTEAFQFYIPFITVQLGLSALLAVYLIIKREMALLPKIAGYCIKGYSIAILIGLLTIDRVVEAPAGLLREGNPPVDMHFISMILNNVMKGLFVLIIVLTLIEIIKDIVKKIKGTTEDILPE